MTRRVEYVCESCKTAAPAGKPPMILSDQPPKGWVDFNRGHYCSYRCLATAVNRLAEREAWESSR